MPTTALEVRRNAAGDLFVPASTLKDVVFGGEVPENEQWRRYYGRGITPEVIECVIRQAELGYMRDLTDLVYETIFFDPHLSTIVPKRLRALAKHQPEVIAAEGPGVDTNKAAKYADVVRANLKLIPGVPQTIVRLNWGHVFGRAALEKQWTDDERIPGTKWRLRALDWIHPRRLSFGPDRELRLRDGAWDGAGFAPRGYDLRSIPYKWLSFTPQLFNDYPEREGFGPRTLFFAHFKRYGVREQLILIEIFGKPWRILLVMPDAQVSADQLDAAKETVDGLGANSSARLPKGVDLKTDQPVKGAGELHAAMVDYCDSSNSKLVLGNTRTTDSAPSGQGSKDAEIHQDAEEGIVLSDSWNVNDVLTFQLSHDIIALNYGPDEVIHAPTIRIPVQPPPNPDAEIDRARKASEIMPIKLEEVYKRTGYARPEEGDEVLAPKGADPLGPDPLGGGGGGSGGPAVEIRIHQPTPKEPPAAPAAPGAPGTAPPKNPQDPNAPDDENEEPLGQAEARSLADKMTQSKLPKCEHGRSNRCRICGIERVRDFTMDDNGTAQWAVVWRAIGDTAGPPRQDEPIITRSSSAREPETDPEEHTPT